ncbi:hypothetical protein ELG63_36365 [Rhizobium leguminosarum]|uniref:hypothetical protein n=1 Tax=Rhizobium leguminosarum TaxID=384 RepID=UPI0010301AE0|nr:hypothetical protein [Rhizobium leguminosarum]TBH28164.1 hypothetical protein ELG63_36365 [Rhizobium leguminosarum]
MLRVIAISLRKPSGNSNTTGGEGAETTDVYVIYLRDGAGVPRFLVLDRNSEGLRCKESDDGRTFSKETVLPESALPDYRLWVHHHYRGWTFNHEGMPSFFRHYLTRYPFFRLFVDRRIQSRFNRQLLTRMDRFKVLEHFRLETTKDNRFSASAIDLMTEFYTARWVHRPDQDELQNYYDLLLEALCESQDLQVVDKTSRYRMRPKAINTISDFALEERRHAENRNIQIAIVGLTIILLIVGAAQAVAAIWEAFFKAAT